MTLLNRRGDRETICALDYEARLSRGTLRLFWPESRVSARLLTSKSATLNSAKNFPRQRDHAQNPWVADGVKHFGAVFAAADYAAGFENAEVLGNVALGGADGVYNFLHDQFT